MREDQLQRYRKRLGEMRAALVGETALGEAGTATVTLDQQSVGRLSRMDALQQQAMARATEARRAARLQRIRAALLRMEEGEYGWCVECGGEIAPARLDLDPTVPTCITCARGG